MTENEIGTIVVNAAIEVHRVLGGPGLLESVYEEALCVELRLRGLHVERQKGVRLNYKGEVLAHDLRLDVLVENKVIVEAKATSQYNAIYESQTLTYLRMSSLKLGYVINFGEKLLKTGIHRVINGILM